jgi:hypothetical protein
VVCRLLKVFFFRYVMAVGGDRKLSPALAHQVREWPGAQVHFRKPLAGQLAVTGTNFDLFDERSNTCR